MPTYTAQQLHRRALRAAKSLKLGNAIFVRLSQKDAGAAMIKAAEDQVPAVAYLQEILLGSFDKADLTPVPVKSFIGIAVRALMAMQGFERTERGVRTGPAVTLFTAGAVYAKSAEPLDGADETAATDAPEALLELLTIVSERLLLKPDRMTLAARLAAMP